MAKKKKRTKLYVFLGIVLIALSALAVYKSKTREKGKEVETAQVSKRNIKEIVSASGKIFPEKEVIISSDVSGEIVSLPVEEGDSVVMGQILASIDPEAYESQVERGTASLNNTKSQLAISKSNYENSLAGLEQVKVQLNNAKRRHDRNIKLRDQGVISEVEYETTLTELESAQANVQATQASIRAAEETIKANEYAIKSSEAALKELQTSLKRTTITAPVSGIISKLDVEEGERVVGTIQMTGTEMMRIANMSIMEVQVDVSENDILKVELGDSAMIEVDAYLDRAFQGIVSEIANSASSVGSSVALATDQVTNFVVKILMNPRSYDDLVSPTRPFPFRPGMSASVEINTNTVHDVLTVPILAVTTRDLSEGEEGADEDIQEVVFLCQGDTVLMQPVVTGVQDDSHIQVEKGLVLEQEIVSGPYSVVTRELKNGDQFRKKEEKKKGS